MSKIDASALIVDFAFRHMSDLELSNFCDESDTQMYEFFYFTIFQFDPHQSACIQPSDATTEFYRTICEFVDWDQVRSCVRDYVKSRKAAKHAERLSKALEIIGRKNTLIPA